MTTIDPHIISGTENIVKFLLAGKAIFTIRNAETGNRITFKVRQAKDNDGNLVERWFVDVLTGSDNEGSYSFLGTIQNGRYSRSVKSTIGQDALSAKAFYWLWNMLTRGIELPAKVQVWHEGRCGRCSRKLTVPESISTGLGPECASVLGVTWKIQAA